MKNAGLEEAQAGIKIVGRNINNLRYADDTTLMAQNESESEVSQSCLTLCDPMGSSLHQAPPSTGISRQDHWRGLPFPSPGNLLDPGIEPRSPAM